MSGETRTVTVEEKRKFRPGTLGLEGYDGHVLSVTPGSQASGKGIKAGWRLTHLDGKDLPTDWDKAQVEIGKATQGSRDYTLGFSRERILRNGETPTTTFGVKPQPAFHNDTRQVMYNGGKGVARSVSYGENSIQENAQAGAYAQKQGQTWGMLGFFGGAAGLAALTPRMYLLQRLGTTPKLASCCVLGMGGWMYGREKARNEFRQKSWVANTKLRDEQDRIERERRQRQAKLRNEAPPAPLIEVSRVREDFSDRDAYGKDADRLYAEADTHKEGSLVERQQNAFSRTSLPGHSGGSRPEEASGGDMVAQLTAPAEEAEKPKKKKKKKKKKKRKQTSAPNAFSDSKKPSVWD